MFRGLRVLDTTVSLIKTAEPIQMPFGRWTRVGPKNHMLGKGRIPPGEGTILGTSPGPLNSTVSDSSDAAFRCPYSCNLLVVFVVVVCVVCRVCLRLSASTSFERNDFPRATPC